jgi:tripartite ATP-independent transporter DctP family solute receptor
MTRTIAAFLASAVLAVACAPARAEFELTLGHDQAAGHPYDLGVKRFADRVKQATGGAVNVKVFPSGQLGDSGEQFEGLRLGTQDLALAAFSHASQFCTAFGLFGAPFLFDDEPHFAAVFDGEVGHILDASCREQYRVSLVSTFTSGYRLLLNSRRPVRSAADLAGLKIRVMGGEADARTWQIFGAIPSPMPYSEVYSALQAGVIDGAENEPVSILSNRFYEAAPHLARTNHLVLPMGLFMSERTLKRLPDVYRTRLWQEARDAAVWQRELIIGRNAEALAEMQQKYGVRVSELDARELRGTGAAIQDYMAATLGLQDLLAKVRAAAHRAIATDSTVR